MGVLRLAAFAACAAAGLVGLVALVGWLAGLPLATNWEPHLASMKPVTALATLLIASAILPQLPLGPRWRIAFGAIAALLGALSLIQEFGGLESWLTPDAAAPGSTLLDLRMSPAAAFAVLLAGICWRIDGGIFTMSWTERDGPRVSAPRQQGFGSTVVSAMAKRSVQGEVHVDYAPSGVIWSLTCPSANALEVAEREELEHAPEKRQAS